MTDTNNPNYDPLAPKAYEITPAWESGVITAFSSNMTVPGDNLSPGQTYRVRVRYQDQAGRWSHWSNASQFIVDPPLVPVHDKIRVTELNYHPAAPTAAEIAAGFTDPTHSSLSSWRTSRRRTSILAVTSSPTAWSLRSRRST